MYKKVNEPKADPKLDKRAFQWTGKHQETFNLLNACLTGAPVPCYPDFSHPFELETDASLQGLGTMLS